MPSATCAQLALRAFAEILDILRGVSFIWVYVKKPSPLAPAHAWAVKVNLSIDADLPAFSLRIAAALNAGTNNRAEKPERLARALQMANNGATLFWILTNNAVLKKIKPPSSV